MTELLQKVFLYRQLNSKHVN